MRALFTFTGGSGHFLPTAPFAQVLRERGHEVMYACQEGMVPTVRSAGWACVASGGNTLLSPHERRPLAAVDRVAEESTIRRFFAGTVARERTGRLLEIARRWRPDVIVRDEVDFAGAVAAEVLDLPHAAVVVIAAGGFLRADVIAEPMTALCGEYGLHPPGSAMAMLHRFLTIVPCPQRFRDPTDPLPRTAHWVRPTAVGQVDGRGQGSGGGTRLTRGRPRVYVTLGTIFNQECGDLFQRVLAGLGRLPVDVLATVGHQIDPAEVGPLPANARVESFVPLADILADADVVVSHGGSGTVIAALAFGLPQIVLPLGADQPLNADRCAALGVGIALDALHSTPFDIGRATNTVLRTPTYRERARRLQTEIASLPDAQHVGALLERLVQTKTPMYPSQR